MNAYREVLRLSMDGHEVREIARRLLLGRATVREYLYRARRRNVVRVVATDGRCGGCGLLEPHECLHGEAAARSAEFAL